jgi:hypothetical protein
MASSISRLTVDQFILECSELSIRLDSVNRRAGDETVVSAFRRGWSEYDSLVRRRDELEISRTDAPLIQLMLDGLRARLQHLTKDA